MSVDIWFLFSLNYSIKFQVVSINIQHRNLYNTSYEVLNRFHNFKDTLSQSSVEGGDFCVISWQSVQVALVLV